MKKIIHDLGNHLAVLEINSERVLGIRISAAKKNFALTRLSFLKDEPGYIAAKNGVELWNVSGTAEIGNAVYFYGPYFEGKPLSEALQQPGKLNTGVLGRLADALLKIRNKISGIYTNGILIGPDGTFLFLPPVLMDSIANNMNVDDKLVIFERYNYPGLSGEGNLLFGFSVIVYQALTEEYPFPADDSQTLHDHMIKHRFLPIEILRPGLPGQISSFINRNLTEHPSASFDHGMKHYSGFLDREISPDVSEEEKIRSVKKAQDIRKRWEKSDRIQTFFRKRGAVLLIILAGLGVLGALGGTVIKNAFAPPVTIGLSAEEVVRLYYTSFNTLNHGAMEDCTAKGIGKADIQAVMNLYVMVKVRTAYEHTDAYISAQKWYEEGKPPVPDTVLVFGNANIQIEKKRTNVFLVHYERWAPAGDETNTMIGVRETDKVTLSKTGRRNTWVIISIDKISAKGITATG